MSKVRWLLATIAILAMFVGCNGLNSDDAELNITVGYEPSKQIVPAELGGGKLDIGEYAIHGAHPASGATWDRTITAPETTLAVAGISEGTWNITATAFNTSTVAVELGAGAGSGVADAESPATVPITVVPYTTTEGVLELHITHGSYVIEEWRGSIDKPGEIDPIHTFTTTDFTPTDNGDGTTTSVCTIPDLVEGWYFISIELWDEISQPEYQSVLDSGLLDCALIVARADNSGMTTLCDWLLPVSGGISIELIPDLYNIVTVVLSGVPAFYTRFSQPQVTATVNVPGYVEGEVYVIFALDGDIQQEGTTWSYLLPDNLGKSADYGKNTFRVDALVYTLSEGCVSMGSDWDFLTIVEVEE